MVHFFLVQLFKATGQLSGAGSICFRDCRVGDKVEKQIRLKSNWTKGEIASVFDDDPI